MTHKSLDLDCIALSGFDEDDKVGLERITELICSVKLGLVAVITVMSF